VHALGQVAHFETRARRAPRAWVLGANSTLCPSISVLWALTVPAHFHARYSAAARCYRYLILNRPARPALAARRVTWVHRPLDAGRMALAAAALRGEHDFSSFRSSECQSRTSVRRVEAFEVRRERDLVVIEVTANAFLHHMVRNLAGLLIAVGQGELEAADVPGILEARDRGRAPATAAADGLYLVGVRYPAAFRLPAAPAAVPGDPL